jgi:hypothetical protein
MFGHIEVKDTLPIMRNNKETIQQSKVQHWHGKEVHCGDNFAMIAQKGRPSVCRLGTPRRSPHPAQDGTFRNIEAKHLQFSMNAWRTPSPVLSDHAKDEFAQFPADAFPSHALSMPREPRPIQLEPCPMPADDSLRLNEDQCPYPAIPQLPQHHPEQFVRNSKSRLRILLFENTELLTKSQVFQEQITA